MATIPNMPIGTAAVSWADSNGLNIHVYSTDGYNVTERIWSDHAGRWTNGNFSQAGEAVSATSCLGSNGAQIRVYCTFEDQTTEWCSDFGGDWYKGGYTST
jgi:hypothetical protein